MTSEMARLFPVDYRGKALWTFTSPNGLDWALMVKDGARHYLYRPGTQYRIPNRHVEDCRSGFRAKGWREGDSNGRLIGEANECR